MQNNTNYENNDTLSACSRWRPWIKRRVDAENRGTVRSCGEKTPVKTNRPSIDFDDDYIDLSEKAFAKFYYIRFCRVEPFFRNFLYSACKTIFFFFLTNFVANFLPKQSRVRNLSTLRNKKSLSKYQSFIYNADQRRKILL